MRPIETSPVQAVRAAETSQAHASRGRRDSRPAGRDTEVEVVRSSLLDAKQPPIDAAKVEAIRHAIAIGAYVLSPADIAEAMIALADFPGNQP